MDSNLLLLTQTRTVKFLSEISEDDRAGSPKPKQEELSILYDSQ